MTFNFNVLDAVIIPIITLIILFTFNYLTNRHNKKQAELNSEGMAYERVEFLTSELKQLRTDLEAANLEIDKLKTISRQRDLDILEAERLKNVALSEVTRLLKENDLLNSRISYYERDK